MKKMLLMSVLTVVATAAQAQYRTYGTGSNSSSHSVSGFTTSQVTYVQPHTATNPNSTQYDNYGSRGNYIPNNGTFATRSPRY